MPVKARHSPIRQVALPVIFSADPPRGGAPRPGLSRLSPMVVNLAALAWPLRARNRDALHVDHGAKGSADLL